MASKVADRFGPGWLKIGATGSEKAFAADCSEIMCEPKHDEPEKQALASGDIAVTSAGKSSYVLKFKLLQSFDMTGLLAWCRTNHGQAMPFSFRPRTDKNMEVKGTIIVRALTIGGEADKAAWADAEFPGTEDLYTLATVSP